MSRHAAVLRHMAAAAGRALQDLGCDVTMYVSDQPQSNVPKQWSSGALRKRAAGVTWRLAPRFLCTATCGNFVTIRANLLIQNDSVGYGRTCAWQYAGIGTTLGGCV